MCMKFPGGETLIFKKLKNCHFILRNSGKVFILVIFRSYFPKDSAGDLSCWMNLDVVKGAVLSIIVRTSQGHPRSRLGLMTMILSRRWKMSWQCLLVAGHWYFVSPYLPPLDMKPTTMSDWHHCWSWPLLGEMVYSVLLQNVKVWSQLKNHTSLVYFLSPPLVSDRFFFHVFDVLFLWTDLFIKDIHVHVEVTDEDDLECELWPCLKS